LLSYYHSFIRTAYRGIKGEKGDRGPKGDSIRGPPGPPGPPGPKGESPAYPPFVEAPSPGAVSIQIHLAFTSVQVKKGVKYLHDIGLKSWMIPRQMQILNPARLQLLNEIVNWT